MYPMVIDSGKRECDEEMAQELLTVQFHEHLRQQIGIRLSREAQEAQGKARAAKAAERGRYLRHRKRLRDAGQTAVSAIIVIGLHIAESHGLIANNLATVLREIASVYCGWKLHCFCWGIRAKNRKGGTRKR